VVVRRRLAAATLFLVLVLVSGALFAPAAVEVINVDGPPVSVQVAGQSAVLVPCPGREIISVSYLNLVPREIVVSDARTGLVLRQVLAWRDTRVLVRGTRVLVGQSSPASEGPFSLHGCL
jgi:hypothetical protein